MAYALRFDGSDRLAFTEQNNKLYADRTESDVRAYVRNLDGPNRGPIYLITNDSTAFNDYIRIGSDADGGSTTRFRVDRHYAEWPYQMPTDGLFHEVRFVRTGAFEFRLYVDGEDLGPPDTVSGNGQQLLNNAARNQIGGYNSSSEYRSSFDFGWFEYRETVDGPVVNRIDASQSGGNGSQLGSSVGNLTFDLIGPDWPTDDSQWVYYEDAAEPENPTGVYALDMSKGSYINLDGVFRIAKGTFGRIDLDITFDGNTSGLLGDTTSEGRAILHADKLVITAVYGEQFTFTFTEPLQVGVRNVLTIDVAANTLSVLIDGNSQGSVPFSLDMWFNTLGNDGDTSFIANFAGKLFALSLDNGAFVQDYLIDEQSTGDTITSETGDSIIRLLGYPTDDSQYVQYDPNAGGPGPDEEYTFTDSLITPVLTDASSSKTAPQQDALPIPVATFSGMDKSVDKDASVLSQFALQAFGNKESAYTLASAVATATDATADKEVALQAMAQAMIKSRVLFHLPDALEFEFFASQGFTLNTSALLRSVRDYLGQVDITIDTEGTATKGAVMVGELALPPEQQSDYYKTIPVYADVRLIAATDGRMFGEKSQVQRFEVVIGGQINALGINRLVDSTPVKGVVVGTTITGRIESITLK